MKTSTPSSRPLPPETSPAALSLARPVRGLPRLMGVVNATPDSFYPGSRAPSVREAVDLALRQRDEGADLIDVGGQSTRPGSEPVPAAEELGRVLPVIEALAGRLDVPISVDTDKAEVARRALSAGAAVLNDVSALRADPGMLEVALRYPAVILMHMRGTSPKTMQEGVDYGDVVKEVGEFLTERKAAFLRAGGDAARLLVDPGIGFGKELEHNLALIKATGDLRRIAPVVLGLSRKSFIGRLLSDSRDGLPGAEERLEGSLAAACFASCRGVDILRVHDVLATRRALRVWGALSAA